MFSSHSIAILKVLLCIVLPWESVKAYPSGAGTCKIEKGVNGEMLLHGWALNGALKNGTYIMKLNDKAILNETVNATHQLSSGINYKLSLTSNANEDFRGFLFKLESEEQDLIDASNSLGVLDSDNSKEFKSCGNKADGITHKNSQQKNSMDVNMKFPQSGKYKLDVAVVRGNSAKEHDWFFSSYSFNVTQGPMSSASSFTSTLWCIISTIYIVGLKIF